jgi:hypothetical protein
LKIGERKYPLRYATVFGVCFAAEKNCASLASADHLASGDVNEVFVLRMHFRAAQFAALNDSALLYEASQNGEGRLGIADCGLPIADFGVLVFLIV